MSDRRATHSRLGDGGFKREQLRCLEAETILDAFGAWITDVLGFVNDGKEATVYRCRAHPSTGASLLAAKVYRARKFRAFRNDTDYFLSRHCVDRRQSRAMRSGTRLGRTMSHHAWVRSEWDTIQKLYELGGDVPRPMACCDDGILMEYVGDEDGPAPMLVHADLSAEELAPAFELLLRNVELMLSSDIIHGDLSAYNALYLDGRVVIIDLPQVIDARAARDGYSMLLRDVDNICKHFEKRGLKTDAMGLASDLWTRYMHGQL